jgi:hypothetical protein
VLALLVLRRQEQALLGPLLREPSWQVLRRQVLALLGSPLRGE